MRSIAWFKHLVVRRGAKFFEQMYRMWKFHQTPFHDILQNIFDALDDVGAGFTFPTIASVVPYQPDNIRMILREGHEIANHGYKHIRYEHLSDAKQLREFDLSTQIFTSLGIPIHGFRAPYNNYNDSTIELVREHNFLWDGGIGYRREYRNLSRPFKLHDSDPFWCIPLHRYSDDLLIDMYHLNSTQFARAILPVLRNMKDTGGVLMFDFHPIRIGQDNYKQALNEIVEMASSLGAWIPTVKEAVDCWNNGAITKKGSSFCLLLTGDIDNFVFFDYLRRLV